MEKNELKKLNINNLCLRLTFPEVDSEARIHVNSLVNFPRKNREDFAEMGLKREFGQARAWYQGKSHPGNFVSGLVQIWRLQFRVFFIRWSGARVFICQSLVKGFPQNDANSQEFPALRLALQGVLAACGQLSDEEKQMLTIVEKVHRLLKNLKECGWTTDSAKCILSCWFLPCLGLNL